MDNNNFIFTLQCNHVLRYIALITLPLLLVRESSFSGIGNYVCVSNNSVSSVLYKEVQLLDFLIKETTYRPKCPILVDFPRRLQMYG